MSESSLPQSVSGVAFDGVGNLYAACESAVKIVRCADCTESEVGVPKATSAIGVDAAGQHIVAAAKKLVLLRIDGAGAGSAAGARWKLPVLRRYTGHGGSASHIAFLEQKPAGGAAAGGVFATTCDQEHHVCLWTAENATVEDSTKKTAPLRTLPIAQAPASLAASPKGDLLLCLTTGSTVHVWATGDGEGGDRSSVITLTDEKGDASTGILRAGFVSSKPDCVLVAKGTAAAPVFELVRFKEKEEWVAKVAVSPSAVASLMVSAAKKRKGSAVGAGGLQDPHVASAHTTDSSALDAVLDSRQSLGFKREELLRRQREAKQVDRVRITQALQQALARRDQKQLNVLLDEGIARRVVESSVQGLERTYALQLLRECVARFQHQSSRAQSTLVWIKAVLATHPQHLLSLPNLDALLQPLQNVVEDHLRTYNQLAVLQGRLDVVVGRSRSLKNDIVRERGQPLAVISEAEAKAARDLLPAEGDSMMDDGEESEEGDIMDLDDNALAPATIAVPNGNASEEDSDEEAEEEDTEDEEDEEAEGDDDAEA
ncbi:U3 small nucleolar RNA-associated protein 5 [Diplonema papillatum]|nr:U3 small nucleolar RNA-associated protein 5 [Diplonema papillatum]